MLGRPQPISPRQTIIDLGCLLRIEYHDYIYHSLLSFNVFLSFFLVELKTVMSEQCTYHSQSFVNSTSFVSKLLRTSSGFWAKEGHGHSSKRRSQGQGWLSGRWHDFSDSIGFNNIPMIHHKHTHNTMNILVVPQFFLKWVSVRNRFGIICTGLGSLRGDIRWTTFVPGCWPLHQRKLRKVPDAQKSWS